MYLKATVKDTLREISAQPGFELGPPDYLNVLTNSTIEACGDFYRNTIYKY